MGCIESVEMIDFDIFADRSAGNPGATETAMIKLGIDDEFVHIVYSHYVAC